MAERRSEWLCITCGEVLGNVYGGEFYPAVHGEHLRTSGPNLVVKCPKCGHLKTFYSSDPVVRAVYQLVTALSEVAAKSMVEQLGKSINRPEP